MTVPIHLNIRAISESALKHTPERWVLEIPPGGDAVSVSNLNGVRVGFAFFSDQDTDSKRSREFTIIETGTDEFFQVSSRIVDVS